MPARILRDPLFHFMLIGALLFGLNAFFAEEGGNRHELVVSQSRIDHLAAIFERRWQRQPTRAELDRLVENFVREEVLYREALKMGLDSDDTVIRRRLRMKMEFLARDLVDAVEPGDRVLQAYFAKHADKYQRPAEFSFQHIYFGHERRGSLDSEIETARARLHEGVPPEQIGDTTLLQRRYTAETGSRVGRLFGEGFAAQLSKLPEGEWVGPVRSAYGTHLVYLEHYLPQRPAEFAEVRAAVLRDWQADERKSILQAQYEAYRSGYDVRIEGEIPAPDSEVALK